MVGITANQISTLARYRDAGLGAWTTMPEDDRNVYREIHGFLGELAQAVAGDGWTAALTSGFSPKSGIRGNRPKDLWCALLRGDSKPYPFNPQVFVIVSDRGVELGFSAAAHDRDFSNAELKSQKRNALPKLFSSFPSGDAPVIASLEGSLRENGPWHFVRKVRMEPYSKGFSSLSDWLAFVHSDGGIKWGSAAISKYFIPTDLDRPETDIRKEFLRSAEIFKPLLEALPVLTPQQQPTQNHKDLTELIAEAPLLPNVWVEKTSTTNRPDRVQGDHALGKALWSPQRDKRGADIYEDMRSVRPGDVVIHIIQDSQLVGVSVVGDTVDESFVGLEGTQWEGPGYRVPLTGYIELNPPLSKGDFLKGSKFENRLKEIRRLNDRLFFQSNLDLRQGGYITPAPPDLVRCFNRARWER
jgi:hypothetical protein